MKPEKFLQQYRYPDLPINKIIEFHKLDLLLLNAYKIQLDKENEEMLSKVIEKVNFLIRACLREDNDVIVNFIATYGKINEDDSFGLDYEKIINER